MKNIIIGQLLLWLNLATMLAGWKILVYFNPPEGVQIMIAIIGFAGSVANVVFSIAIQARSYIKMGMVNFD